MLFCENNMKINSYWKEKRELISSHKVKLVAASCCVVIVIEFIHRERKAHESKEVGAANIYFILSLPRQQKRRGWVLCEISTRKVKAKKGRKKKVLFCVVFWMMFRNLSINCLVLMTGEANSRLNWDEWVKSTRSGANNPSTRILLSFTIHRIIHRSHSFFCRFLLLTHSFHSSSRWGGFFTQTFDLNWRNSSWRERRQAQLSPAEVFSSNMLESARWGHE